MSCNACFPNLPYNGVPAGTQPISLLRAGKDTMAYRHGTVITTYMGDYIPPLVMPMYSGHLPGVATMCGSTFGNATKKYYRMFRQEQLARHVRPKMVYGRFPCDFTPFPDVASAQKSMVPPKICETPNIRSPGVDFNRRLELQKFYSKCQNHRDYYLDKSEKVLPDPYFYLGTPYPVRCPIDERVFKIRRSIDKCNKPGFLGPPIYCGSMPCIQKNGMLVPFELPRLPRPPFQCDAVKRADPDEWQVLLV